MNLRQTFMSFKTHKYSVVLTVLIGLILFTDFTASNFIKYNNTVTFNQEKLRTQQLPLTADIITNDIGLRVEKVQLHLAIVRELLTTFGYETSVESGEEKLNQLMTVWLRKMSATDLFLASSDKTKAGLTTPNSSRAAIVALLLSQDAYQKRDNQSVMVKFFSATNAIVIAEQNRSPSGDDYQGIVAVFNLEKIFPQTLSSIVEDKANFYLVTRDLEPLQSFVSEQHISQTIDKLDPADFKTDDIVVVDNLYYMLLPTPVADAYILISKNETRVLKQIRDSFTSIIIIDFLVILLTLALIVACIVYFTVQLQEQANKDALTGIPNRQAFEQFIQSHIVASRRQSYHCVLLIDIDYFKRVNDTFGHLTGDKVLQRMADILAQNIRKTDFLCRWGGEEFVIIATGTTLSDATELAEKIRLHCANEIFDCLADQHQITLSIGVAQYTRAISVETATNNADEALYRAKNNGRNNGRNKVEVFEAK
jgi:diguanylate cyclase (GGDEF)-like protein